MFLNFSDEIRIDVEYPEFLDLVGGRPEIFSANGSHGVWSQPGQKLELLKISSINVKSCIVKVTYLYVSK